jgi:hypothetical protein
MLDSGYPRQSSAFHKIAGIRTNFTVPAVHNIALGGGSICRVHCDRISVGPDSVGADLEKEGIYFGGKTLTVSPVPLTQSRVTWIFLNGKGSSDLAGIKDLGRVQTLGRLFNDYSSLTLQLDLKESSYKDSANTISIGIRSGAIKCIYRAYPTFH